MEKELIALLGLAVVLSIKEVYNSNGRRKLHERINKTVFKKDCHRAVDGMKTMIGNYEKHADKRFEDYRRYLDDKFKDLKDTVIKNGKNSK